MKINFDVYNVFYYVAKFKSITLASKYLHVSQPAVTRQIKNLEISLGYTLFIRNKSGLCLTSKAMELYTEVSKAIEIFNQIESKNNATKPFDGGVIKILSGYATTKNVLLPIVNKFNKLYPKTKVYIEYYPFDEAISKLRNGEVDILLMNSEDHIQYSDLCITEFYELNDILVVSKSIKDKYPKFIKLEDINSYPIICKRDYNNSRKFITNYLNKLNMDFEPTWELTDYWLVEEYIRMNMGIGIVSRQFINDELSSGQLIELKTDVELPKRTISYAIRKNCILRPEMIKFMKLFSESSNI